MTIGGESIPVSVLFARSASVYKSMGCDVWDMARDARLFDGADPVIAHPPCRAWGQLAYMAKPRRGERALALLAVDWVRRNGGILEHPLRSRLFSLVLGCPVPGAKDAWGGWTLPYDQFWAGHLAQKATRFYIVGIEPAQLPAMPFALGQASHVVSNDSRQRRIKAGRPRRPELSAAAREKTPSEMAQWLVDTALAIGANRSR